MQTESKELLHEEMTACDAPLNAKIHTAELPADSIRGASREAELCYRQYGAHFKSFEDAELFSMLPLDKNHKKLVLMRAIELEKQGQQLREEFMRKKV